MTPIFPGHVDRDGRLILDAPSVFRAHLGKLREKRVEVVVRLFRSQRSLDQNAWVWGVAYPLLCETLGYDRDERDLLHYALIDKCFGSSFNERLNGYVPNKRSSQLTTVEFSEYMEWLVRFAAKELDCVIPLPNEVDYAETK